MQIKTKLTDISGRIFFYLFGALAMVGILNFPIQVLQLFMLGKLSFPDSIPTFPWYVLLFGGTLIILVVMFIAGYIWAKLGIAKAQSQVANENNPQILDIIERLERIESKLPVQNDWR